METCLEHMELYREEHAGALDESVDCTYVQLCCGPEVQRLPSVQRQLQRLNPSKQIKLMFGSGAERCSLRGSVQEDQLLNQRRIFQDALLSDYRYILFLEDDFEVQRPLEEEVVRAITAFVREEQPDALGLGNFMLPLPTDLGRDFQRPLGDVMLMAHAVIYGRRYMQAFLEHFESFAHRKGMAPDSCSVQLRRFVDPPLKLYRYHVPLIFQRFPETASRKEWATLANSISPALGLLRLPGEWIILKVLGMDRWLEPGWTALYWIPPFLYGALLLLALWLGRMLGRCISWTQRQIILS